MDSKFIDSLPEVITVTSEILKKKTGRPSTLQQRRKSVPVQGKVRGRRNHFSEKEKMNAVCVFAVSGNSRRVAEITGIPEGTIRSWKATEWWNEILGRIHTEQDEELNTKLTSLVNKAVDAVNDRIDNGDYIYDVKRGELVRKPVNAKDLTVVTAISIDKRELLRGNPTSRIEKISQDERLLALAKQFKQFTLATEIVQEKIEDASIEREVEEDHREEHQVGDDEWETEETGDSNSDVESWEEQEEKEEEGLTINELFTE